MKIGYRIKFSKFDKMRFIGHLDLLRLFQRTINRSNIPAAYSQGFNPHQLLSFAIPLPLGFESVGEYVDIHLTEEFSESKLQNVLNENFPDGIEILNARKFDSDEKTAASVLRAGLYEIQLEKTNNLDLAIGKILDSEELIASKKTKKGIKETDIRADIFKLEKISTEPEKIRCLVSAGSLKNLKPELVVEVLYDIMGCPYNELHIKYTRIDLFKFENNENEEFVSL